MDNVHTDKIEITVNMLGIKREYGGSVKARERIVMVNGDVVYKDWEAYPYFLRIKKTGNILDDFTRHVSLLEERKAGKDSSRDSGNLVSLLKLIRAKLLFKIINFVQ